MAAAERPGSFLPVIKCSTCGDDIDIMSLADHICLPSNTSGDDTTNVPSTGRPNMKGDPAIQSDFANYSLDPAVQQGSRFFGVQQSLQSPGFSSRVGKGAPPSIDSAAANRPFLPPVDALTPASEYSNYSGDQGLTPVTPNTQVTTPSSMFSRKIPSRSPSPPSPAYVGNLDSAFPPFRSAYDSAADSRSKAAFMKPMASPGLAVMQRMNGIANGPFSNQRSRAMNNTQTGPTERRPSDAQYERRPSDAQYGRRPSDVQYGQQIPEVQSREHYRKESVAQSVQSQTSDYSGQGDFTHVRKGSAEKTKRVVDSIDMFLSDFDATSEPAHMLNRESRSRTFPETTNDPPPPGPNFGQYMSPPMSAAHNRTAFFPEAIQEEVRPSTSAGGSRFKPRENRFDVFKDPAIHNPFIPASRSPPREEGLAPRTQNRDRAVTNANSPEIDPASPWFEAPRASPVPPGIAYRSPSNPQPHNRTRSRTVVRDNGPTAVERFMNSQPPPALPVMASLRTDSARSHSPSDSSSSYASSGLSTAPTSVNSLSRTVSSDSQSRSRGLSRPQRPEALPQATLPSANVPQPLESPIDPAIQSMRAPSLDPAIQLGALGPRSYISNSPPRPRREPQNNIYTLPPPPIQKIFAPVSKGECRACGTQIYGKSVKAADGRLTGRYHKECFSCTTCQAPFATTEFYILKNAPYCQRHYHELNGSMCKKCNRGIEGQYLETDRREKYHATCFACSHCRVRLNEDYYEVDGQHFCERHAFAMGRQRGPNAPAAEKRRTRIMFM